MVARTIGAGHTRAVEHERDSRFMQGNIHEYLIKRPVDKGRINRHHRVEAAIGETRGTGDRVLLGNSHIHHPGGETLGHFVQAGGAEHGSGNTQYRRIFLRLMHHGLGEHVGPAHRTRTRHRRARHRVDLADGVELVGLIVDCRRKAPTFFGNDVNDDRLSVGLGLGKGFFQVLEVVSVDRADIFNVEVGIQRFVVRKARDKPAGCPTEASIDRAPKGTEEIKEGLTAATEKAIRLLRAHRAEESGEATNGWRVGAAVVVDHNDEVAVIVVGDVVHRLPRHSAGECTIAHHRHDVPVALTAHMERPRDAIRPAHRTRRVRALDNVVF